MSCISHTFASVHCCLVGTCWERADLLALVGYIYCIFVTFPCGILSVVWYLIVSLPDLCRLSYFNSKKDQKLVSKTNYHLMQVKSIAECSKGSILQFFQPLLSYQLSIRPLFCLFLSGRFTLSNKTKFKIHWLFGFGKFELSLMLMV